MNLWRFAPPSRSAVTLTLSDRNKVRLALFISFCLFLGSRTLLRHFHLRWTRLLSTFGLRPRNRHHHLPRRGALSHLILVVIGIARRGVVGQNAADCVRHCV